MRIPDVLQDKDVVAGAVFVAFAVLFGALSSPLPMGSMSSMGPGFLPFGLSLLLGLFGALILVRGMLRPAHKVEPVASLRFLAIPVSLLVFAFGVRGAGLGLTVFAMVLIASLGSKKVKPISAVLLAAFLTAFCWAAFVVGLRLPLALLGPWFGGY